MWMWEKNISPTVVRIFIIQPSLKTIWALLEKLKICYHMTQQFYYLHTYLPQGPQTLFRKYTYALMFILALFIITKLWKLPKYPRTDDWIKKLWYICMYTCVHKRLWYIYTYIYNKMWIDPHNIMMSIMSQREKDNISLKHNRRIINDHRQNN